MLHLSLFFIKTTIKLHLSLQTQWIAIEIENNVYRSFHSSLTSLFSVEEKTHDSHLIKREKGKEGQQIRRNFSTKCMGKITVFDIFLKEMISKNSILDLICQQYFCMETTFFSLQHIFPSQSMRPSLVETLKASKKTGLAQKDSESQSFQPQYHQIKKLGLKINKKKISTGGWSPNENKVYLQFMLDNTEDFLSEKTRRKKKVFYRLSKILKKRTPDQCRSHHQKLQLRYKDDLGAIINEVQRKIQTCLVQEYMNTQHPIQRHNIALVREELLLPRVEPQFRQIHSQSWFSIKSSGSSYKFIIDANSISSW